MTTTNNKWIYFKHRLDIVQGIISRVDSAMLIFQRESEMIFSHEKEFLELEQDIFKNIFFVLEYADEKNVFDILVFMDIINQKIKQSQIEPEFIAVLFRRKVLRDSVLIKRYIINIAQRTSDIKNRHLLYYLMLFNKHADTRKMASYAILTNTDNPYLWWIPTLVLLTYNDDFLSETPYLYLWFINQPTPKQLKYLDLLMNINHPLLAGVLSPIFSTMETSNPKAVASCLSFIQRYPIYIKSGLTYLKRIKSPVALDFVMSQLHSFHHSQAIVDECISYLSYVSDITDSENKEKIQMILHTYISTKIINKDLLLEDFEITSFKQVCLIYNKWKMNYDEFDNSIVLKMMDGIFKYGLQNKKSYNMLDSFMEYSLNADTSVYSYEIKRQIMEHLASMSFHEQRFIELFIQYCINNRDERIREISLDIITEKKMHVSEEILNAVVYLNKRETLLYNKQKILYIVRTNSLYKYELSQTLDK